ncbi:MAG: family 78 glycoside hydrolase catalytic domain, partial [Proteiniphilum sp.]
MQKRILLLILSLFSLTLKGQSDGIPSDLKCDYLENPVGIDNPFPRLTWQIDDDSPGAIQSAFSILVGTDSLEVENGEGSMWHTKKIHSQQQLVSYAGAALQPFTKYYWKVITWNKKNDRNASTVYSFETGMMDIKNWQGNWISDGRDIQYKPAPCFRKQFTARNEIVSARVYVAVAGLYELYINGMKIGNQRLDPMYTRFDRRNFYVTHDVTTQLQQGENAVGVILGNGWYNHQSLAVWDFEKAPWRNRPAFCLDLRITYTDGSVETISSDLSWKQSNSPIIFNSIYTGEHYDTRLKQDGWSEPGFDDTAWQKVALRAAPSQNITAQQLRPIRNVRSLPAVSFRKIDDRTYLYDFGQNMAGVTRIKVSGKEGSQLR